MAKPTETRLIHKRQRNPGESAPRHLERLESDREESAAARRAEGRGRGERAGSNATKVFSRLGGKSVGAFFFAHTFYSIYSHLVELYSELIVRMLGVAEPPAFAITSLVRHDALPFNKVFVSR